MDKTENLLTMEGVQSSNHIFVYAMPRATNSLKELFVARYPNGKVEPEPEEIPLRG
ncbi:MAG: hypothetical protein K2K63_06890 [Acetatifactor sp.]|nr:hypothetical protein [Acetatifactor sp.]